MCENIYIVRFNLFEKKIILKDIYLKKEISNTA